MVGSFMSDLQPPAGAGRSENGPVGTSAERPSWEDGLQGENNRVPLKREDRAGQICILGND